MKFPFGTFNPTSLQTTAAACSDAAPAYCDQRHAGGDIVCRCRWTNLLHISNHLLILNKANPSKGSHHNLQRGNSLIQSQQQLSKILCCDWMKFAEAARQFSEELATVGSAFKMCTDSEYPHLAPQLQYCRT